MIDKFIYSQNNLIGLVLLLIIFFDMKSNSKKMKYDHKLFLIIIFTTALVMITDIMTVALNGLTGYLLRETNIALTTIHFMLSTLPYMTWSMYVDFYIHRNVRRTKRRIPIFIIPAIITMILSLLSLYNQGIFFISEDNVYHRGHLFLINFAIYFIYFIGTYIQMILNKKNIRKKDYYTLLLFGLVPAIMGGLQSTYLGASFVWLGVSISVLLIYFNIQNSEINEDYLTGLYNRRQLDFYLERSIQKLDENRLLFMIMIDIDDFKEINDTYGHVEGDNALKHTADLFISTFRTDDFIARYAGDEFIIIMKLENKDCKEDIINRLRGKLRVFNNNNIIPYDINLSLGYDIYDPASKMDAIEFIMHVDNLMYQDK